MHMNSRRVSCVHGPRRDGNLSVFGIARAGVSGRDIVLKTAVNGGATSK